jgi:hypothetical protein
VKGESNEHYETQCDRSSGGSRSGHHIEAGHCRPIAGNGNLSGSYLVNEPTAGSTTGARTIATGTQAGTYTVNCNGTGQFVRTLTQSNGTVTTGVDDFIITASVKVYNGASFVMLATTIADAQESPSAIIPGGIFLVRTQNRLPDWNGVY